jgi:hypothetical protein
MADPTPVLPEPVTEGAPYRPLAGLAIASMAIAAFYALIVTVFGLMALIGGNPVFLTPWALVFPVLAVILAAAARWQIRSAEGTRSGLALATWGGRLALVFGISHAAIFFGTLLAVWMQAQNELEQNFFAKIKEGNIDDAFQFTINPDQRATIKEIRQRFLSMEGGKKGPLSRFREHDIVRAIQGGGANTQTESMGIKSMDLSTSGYGVVMTYRITTPEGVFLVQFTLRSKDSKESKKRRWQVVWKDADTFMVSKQLSAAGEKMQFWQTGAHEFANTWMFQRMRGLVDEAFLGTYPAAERDERRRQYRTAIVASSLGSAAAALGDAGQGLPLARFAPLIDPNLGCELAMPGFHRYSSGELLDTSEFEVTRKTKDEILAMIHQNLLRPNQMGFRPSSDPGVTRRVEGDAPHLQALFTFEMAIVDPSGFSSAPKYAGTAELVLASDRPPESEAGAPQWRLTGIKILAAAKNPDAGPGGPGGKMTEMMRRKMGQAPPDSDDQ